MPRRSPSQAIGCEGERWFVAQLPAHWIPQLPTSDVGVDVLVVICEDGKNNGLEFKVQIKSSTKWAMSDENILVSGFRRESLIDLLHGFTPALLVLYEASSKSGYCCWLNHLIARDPTLIQGDRKTLTLKVPMERRINADLWSILAAEVRGSFRVISRRILMAGLAMPILEATHSLMRSLHLIDLCANGEGGQLPPNEIIEAELTAHKEIVTTLQSLQAALVESGSSIIGIDETAERYILQCEAFFPDFRKFLQGAPNGTSFEMSGPGFRAHRAIASRTVNQIVSKLTLLTLEGARSARTNDA